jgi:hypothetical protein
VSPEVNKLLVISDYPTMLAEWDYERNKGIDPSKVTIGRHTMFHWKCRFVEDHRWEKSAHGRSRGKNGCPCCDGKKAVLSNCLATTHPELAEQWHPTLNGSLTPHNVCFGSNKKVWWKCSIAEDHEWEASPNNRTNIESGCPCCKGKKIVLSNCLATLCPEVAKEWHPTKNGDLTPYQISKSSGKKIWWLCQECKDAWLVSASQRTCCYHTGCPFCKESRGERAVKLVLDNCDVYYLRQFRFKNCKNILSLPFDFIFSTKQREVGLIEYQGEQHYKPILRFGGEDALIQRQVLDQIKRDFCQERDLPLLEIPYWNYKIISQMVNEFLYTIKGKTNDRFKNMEIAS